MKERLIDELKELQQKLHKNESKRLQLPLMQRLVVHFSSYSHECANCQQHLEMLQSLMNEIKASYEHDKLVSFDFKEQKRKMKSFTSHLKEEHLMIYDGYYTSLYMSIGVGIGVAFGMTVMDNSALGMSIGIGLGLALGSSMDAKQKKAGNVI